VISWFAMEWFVAAWFFAAGAIILAAVIGFQRFHEEQRGFFMRDTSALTFGEKWDLDYGTMYDSETLAPVYEIDKRYPWWSPVPRYYVQWHPYMLEVNPGLRKIHLSFGRFFDAWSFCGYCYLYARRRDFKAVPHRTWQWVVQNFVDWFDAARTAQLITLAIILSLTVVFFYLEFYVLFGVGIVLLINHIGEWAHGRHG